MDSLSASAVAAHDAAYYAERDHRRVMLGGDAILQVFDSQGVPAVRNLLQDWAAKFRLRTDPAARDWSWAISQCVVFVMPFPRGGRHLMVDLPSKICCDELCS